MPWAALARRGSSAGGSGLQLRCAYAPARAPGGQAGLLESRSSREHTSWNSETAPSTSPSASKVLPRDSSLAAGAGASTGAAMPATRCSPLRAETDQSAGPGLWADACVLGNRHVCRMTLVRAGLRSGERPTPGGGAQPDCPLPRPTRAQVPGPHTAQNAGLSRLSCCQATRKVGTWTSGQPRRCGVACPNGAAAGKRGPGRAAPSKTPRAASRQEARAAAAAGCAARSAARVAQAAAVTLPAGW